MWRLAEDTITEEEIGAAADWLRSAPIITQGEQIRRFEAAWAAWHGTAHAVFVSSGTTANFALVACAQERVGRRPLRVGVSSVTWSTNVSPSLLLGHEVVVLDVDPRTLGVDPAQTVAAIEAGRLDVLFVTHLLGFDALDPRILEACASHDVLLLEDCCESHGATHAGRKVGGHGLGGTFSFYYGHHMSTIEGGMISTDDADFADRLRLMRAHGLARESSRFDELAAASPEVDRRFLFVATGLNFRSTEINAVLGQSQLAKLDERIAIRNRNLERFLAQAPAWLRTDYRLEGVSSFAFPLIADTPERRTAVQATLDALAIESRPVVAGNLLAHPFMAGEEVSLAGDGVPQAEHVHRCGLYVGNGHHVTEAMVDRLGQALRAL